MSDRKSATKALLAACSESWTLATALWEENKTNDLREFFSVLHVLGGLALTVLAAVRFEVFQLIQAAGVSLEGALLAVCLLVTLGGSCLLVTPLVFVLALASTLLGVVDAWHRSRASRAYGGGGSSPVARDFYGEPEGDDVNND